MITILKRELLSYFITMTGWVFAGLFMLMSAVYFLMINVFGLMPDYSLTLQNAAIMFMILVPALCMRFFTGEVRQNTDRLLYTLPVKPSEIVIGKFLGGVLLFLFSLVLTVIFPAILSAFGTLPTAQIAGTFIGFFFLGCAFIAVGLLVSSLSNSQVISAIGTFCAILFLFLIDVVSVMLPASPFASLVFAFAIIVLLTAWLFVVTKNFYVVMTMVAVGSFIIALTYFAMNDLYIGLPARVLRGLSVMSRFDSFARGILNVADIIYYITFTASLVIVTIAVIKRSLGKTAIAIGILLAINLAVMPFNLSFDLTPERRYTLSDQTIEIIQNLDESVIIYALFPENMFHASHYDTVNELLVRYNRISPNLTVEHRDPVMHPQIIERFRSEFRLPESGGIVVESGGRFHVISPADLVVVDHVFDGEAFAPVIAYIPVEQQVTNAILLVTGDDAQVIYHITGHNETAVPTALIERIETSNYEFRHLDLLLTGEVPYGADMLFITTPGRDFAPFERDLIIEYINGGGRIFAAVQGAFAEFPVFDEIFTAMGVEFDNSLIVEEGSDGHYPGMSPAAIIPRYPEFSTNEVVEHMISRNALTVLPNATGIAAISDSIRVYPLLITSEMSYGITDINAVTIEFIDGYLEGPFNVSASITNFDTDFRAVVVSADTILDEVLNAAIVGGNYEFILSAVNYLAERDNNLFILTQNRPDNYVFMNRTTQGILVFICLILIPGVIFFAGTSLVIKRSK